MQPPRAILMDLGNVLVRFDHMTTCQRLAGPTGFPPEEIHRRLFTSGLERRFDLGEVSEESFAQEVRQALEVTEPEQLPTHEVLAAWAEIFTRDEDNVRLLEPLSRQVQLILLSNTNAAHYREAARMVPELAHCHAQVLSFRERCRKPDPEIFLRCLERAGTSPGETLLVDDGREHIASAAALGLRTQLHLPGECIGPGLRAQGLEVPECTGGRSRPPVPSS